MFANSCRRARRRRASGRVPHCLQLVSTVLLVAAGCGNGGAQVPPDSAIDSTMVPEASTPDTASNHDQGAGNCDLGLAAWTGGIYQGQDDALLELESGDRTTVVKIAREYVGGGIGESSIFALGGFMLQGGGRAVCIKDRAALDYANSHHNWRDQAIAKAGATTFLLDLTFDAMSVAASWRYEVSAVEDGKNVWGPIELSLTSGPIWN